MTPADVIKLINEKEAKFADLRFTDTLGKEQHVTIPTRLVDHGFFSDGKMFDGSSIAGWKGINESDMILMPDPATAVIDPFYEETTVSLRCDVIEPMTMQGYERDPRSLAKRAEAYLKSSGVADSALFGPENEFFIFDNVHVNVAMNGCSYEVDSYEGAWNSGKAYDDGNKGHRPGVKGGYFPVPPVDSQQDIRTAMSLACEEMGLKFEVHHHEVATAGQGEINVAANTLTKKADEVQILKYALQNVAHGYGKTLTFMPKPIVGDNGSGMHVHQSLQKEGKALFAGDKYGGLSDIALYYIGGIIKHARAINAFTNASTNSYKRLVPGFEAPVKLAYSARNRSASIRIPWVSNPKGAPHRGALSRRDRESLFRLRRDDARGPRRDPEQDSPRRSRRQGLVRSRARGGQEDPDGVPLARHGARLPGPRPGIPEGGRRVHGRPHRRLHRAQDAGSHPVAHDHASYRGGDVLQLVKVHPA